jgi:hypothetical protein
MLKVSSSYAKLNPLQEGIVKFLFTLKTAIKKRNTKKFFDENKIVF